MSQVIDCLNRAIRVVRDAPDRLIDPESRAEITRSLESILKSTKDDDFMALRRMRAAAKDAEKDMNAAFYMRAHQDVKTEQVLAPRYLAGDPAKSGRQFRQDVSPLPSTRGTDTQSFLTRALGEERALIGGLSEVLSYLVDAPIGRFFRASEGDPQFVRALLGLKVDDPRAKEYAKLVQELFEPYLERLRDAGVWVHKIPNWWFRDYDLARIQTDPERFKDLLRRGLNREAHPDPDATAERVIQSLAERDTVGSKNMGMGMRRKLDLADPEVEFQIYQEFGRGSAGTQLMRVAKALADETTAAEMFGPLWRQEMIRISNEIARNAGVDLGIRSAVTNSTARQLRHAQAILTSQTSDLSRAANFTANNIAAGMQNYVSAAFLGLTVTWQLTVDPILSIIRGAGIQGNVFQAATRQLGAMARLATDPEFRRLARYDGVWRDGIAIQSNSRLPAMVDPAAQLALGIDTSMVRTRSERFLGFSAQLAAVTQRITGSNLLEAWNRSGHHMANLTALADTFDLPWDRLNPRSRQWALEHNAITKADWDSFRKTSITRYGTPDLQEFQNRNPAAHRKFMGMLHRQAEDAVVRSDISDRVVLTLGTTPGTGGNIALSMITQFWAWNTRAIRGPLMRSYHQGTVPFVSVAAGLVASTALGLQLRAVTTGRPLWDMQDPSFWWKATLQSGVLSPLAMDLAASVTPGGQTTIPGAVPSTLQRIGQDTVGGVRDLINGDLEKAAFRGVRITKTAIPNWWQWEWFLSNLYEEVQWELDPEGAAARDRLMRQGRVED